MEYLSKTHSKIIVFNGKAPDEYAPENRKWQGISTIECSGKRLWASWMAGGVKEPDPLNHIVLAYSDDGGGHWTDPYIIIDDPQSESRGRDPVLWMDTEGNLCLFYAFSGDDFTNVLKITNPEDKIGKINIEGPFSVFPKGMILNKPIALHNGEYLCMFDPFDRNNNYSYNCCYVSGDNGRSWKLKGIIHSESPFKTFQEGTVVEKNDGTLYCLLRIEGGILGGLEESCSYDGGKTWSTAVNSLNYPFYGPGTKCVLRKLGSGNILFVNNNSGDTRKNMSVYLSLDDGKTYSDFLLDWRPECAYPDVCQDRDGNIYVIFDCGRSTRNEIRVCRLSEKNIISGDPDGCRLMMVVSKNIAYKDITKAEYICRNKVIVYDEKGHKTQLNGFWQNKIINNKTYCYFNCGDMLSDNFLTDPHGFLLKKASEINKYHLSEI